MAEFEGLLKTIKQAATEAVDASAPAAFLFGTVTSASPIKVKIDQKFEIGAAQIVLTKTAAGGDIGKVTTGEGSGGTVHVEPLKTGDRVLLGRIQGGQQFVIIDKVV